MASLLASAKGLAALGAGAAGVWVAHRSPGSFFETPLRFSEGDKRYSRGAAFVVRSAHAQPGGGDLEPTKESHADKTRGPPADRDEVPGREKSWSTAALEKGAGALQSLRPVKQIHQHICGFHFYAHDMSRQVEAHHFCSHLNEDVIQCVIYDSDAPNARLIGIEYIINEHQFLSLPDEEKKLWHSHEYEVKGGIITAPGLPTMVENKKMEQLAKTYGKTWHTWQFDRGDKVPLGPPALMMAFTADGQMQRHLLEGRDHRCGVDTDKLKKARAYIQGLDKGPHPLADYWKTGKGWAVVLKEVPFQGEPHPDESVRPKP